MPILLAIETSTEIASAALLAGEQLLAKQASGVQNHSQTLLPMVQALLAEAGLQLSQLDAIAYGAGPGSFTGVRTACGIAQGLSFGLNCPVIPINTLEAMAEAARQATGTLQVLPILDARMGEVYYAAYQYVAGAWQVSLAPALSAPDQLPSLADMSLVACGNGVAMCQPFLSNAGIELVPQSIMPHANQVAQLGLAALQSGRTMQAADAQPFYLRNKVAQTSAERALSKQGQGDGGALR